MFKSISLLLVATLLFIAFNYSFAIPSPRLTLGGGTVVVIMDRPCVYYSPNPANNGIVSMEAIEEEAQVLSVKLTDVNNNVIFSESYQAHQVVLNFSNLAEGEYTIEVKTSKCTVTGRCIAY